uniref:Coat protein n=1 Tax=Subalpine fir deltapartitivirus TaxID=2933091 RepID=A0A9C7GX45_9VIRU|nr:putative coat protein [Subalpine fir deltapartitivirus]CAI5384014.1 putative coat protein [Subalpine fir deltapartitivirus]
MAETRESAGSSPTGSKKRREYEQADPSGPSKIQTTRSDVSKVPRSVRDAINDASTDQFVVGNKAAEFIYATEGVLGYKPFVKDLYENPTLIELNIDNIRSSIALVLFSEIRDRLEKRRDVTESDVNKWSDEWATIMTNSTILVIYQKLRIMHKLINVNSSRFAAKVNVTGDLEIPLPYAHCIQELGHVRISDLTKEMFVVPTFPDNVGFGTASFTDWSHAKHNRVVRSMKDIDISFATVDVRKIRGSTWWLYQQIQTGSSVRLVCPLPEVNFHEGGAVLHSLFLKGESQVIANEIADLNPIQGKTYGLMLQNPPPGIQYCSFRALCSEDQTQWQP